MDNSQPQRLAIADGNVGRGGSTDGVGVGRIKSADREQAQVCGGRAGRRPQDGHSARAERAGRCCQRITSNRGDIERLTFAAAPDPPLVLSSTTTMSFPAAEGAPGVRRMLPAPEPGARTGETRRVRERAVRILNFHAQVSR